MVEDEFLKESVDSKLLSPKQEKSNNNYGKNLLYEDEATNLRVI